MSLSLATLTFGGGTALPVHFNPSSLRVTTTNQFDDDHPNQVSKATTFKLDVELLFDTTEAGTDVYFETRAIRDAASATAQGATAKKGKGKAASNLPLATLAWGTTAYSGYIETLNETLDYWTSDGVPLRSTIQLSLKGSSDTFLAREVDLEFASYATDDNPAPDLPSIVMTSAPLDQKRFTSAAQAAGDRSTGRGLAAQNGAENMRSGAGASPAAATGPAAPGGAGAGAFAAAGASAGGGAGIVAAAGAGAQLQAAAGFKLAGGVSAGASVGFGAGASAGLSAGAGLGASVGVGLSAGAGIGGGIGIGGGMSAGAGASLGAGLGGSAGGGGFGVTTSVTGFDGVTTTRSSVTGLDGITTSSTTTAQGLPLGIGSASAGVSASAGAFAGLGASRTTLPGAGFDPDRLLPPPLPAGGVTTTYDVSGRAVSGNGMVAASYAASAGVTVW